MCRVSSIAVPLRSDIRLLALRGGATLGAGDLTKVRGKKLSAAPPPLKTVAPPLLTLEVIKKIRHHLASNNLSIFFGNLLENFAQTLPFLFLQTVLGPTVALMLCPSVVSLSVVCNICVVAKRCVLEQKLL